MRIAAAVLPLIVCSLSVLSSSIHHSMRRTGEGVRIRSASLDASRPRLQEAYGRLPMSFEANLGQTDSRVAFVARGDGYRVFLTSTEAAFAVGDTALRMRLVGANSHVRLMGINRLPGSTNYLRGSDSRSWLVGVPTYDAVRAYGVYPGVDLVYRGNQRQLEYDFIVGPGANPKGIRWRFDGATAVTIDSAGDLLVQHNGKEMRQRKPVIFQTVSGERRNVEGGYVITAEREIGFTVAAYDTTSELVIDPVLLYSTYLGGSGLDTAEAIAIDRSGSAYVTGTTASADLPTTPGAFQTTPGGCASSAFVAKLNPRGSSFEYTTYLGCASAADLAVDSDGNAYVTGETAGAFPTTPGAVQLPCSIARCDRTAFVTKLNPAGSALVYSALIGSAVGTAIAVGADGSAYVSGATPASSMSETIPDAFVVKLTPSGSALAYFRQFGGSGGDGAVDIAIDALGNAYAAGITDSPDFPVTPGAFQTARQPNENGFVTKLDPAGSLVYSTYFGSAVVEAIAADSTGHAYITGFVFGGINGPRSFTTTPGAFQPAYGGGPDDAFVTKLTADGTGLVFSTFLGGTDFDGARALALDGNANVYLTGFTGSLDFPLADALQPESHISEYLETAFVTKLNAAGAGLIYSTYLGGRSGDEGLGVAADDVGNTFVVGNAGDYFPLVIPAQTRFGGMNDLFIAKIGDGPACPPDVTGRLAVYTSPLVPFVIPQLQLQLVIVQNPTSAAFPVDGPLAFVTEGLQNGVLIAPAPRTTICAPTSGSQFVVLPTGPDGELQLGEATAGLLLFYRPGPGPIVYSPRILSTIPGS